MMKADPRKNQRKVSGSATPGDQALSFGFNEEAGAHKMLNIGPGLDPINLGSSYTTDASVANGRKIGMGNAMAFWAPSAGSSITFFSTGNLPGNANLAAGVVDANGNVGIPLAAGWNYFSSAGKDSVITSSGVMTFYVSDQSYLIPTNL